jgi:RNA-directed DNA polymerase
MSSQTLLLSTDERELRNQFHALQTREDIAALLEIDEEQIVYHLYIVPPSKRYLSFEIPKKSGDFRTISAPATALKIIQSKLSQVLFAVYEPKASVHGYTLGRNIVTNAKAHLRQKYVLNVDLKDFFPSINFGRVRGMFLARPYNLTKEIATILAQICCWNNQLPQGAPTSPIISNMICARMDSQLLRLAQKHRCIYTRYADDITFSSSVSQFPASIARVEEVAGQIEIGHELGQIIRGNGFEVNQTKIRLQTKYQRQEVTGLTVNGRTTNRTPNVRRRYIKQIRAMLHAWQVYGIDNAEKEFREKYNHKHCRPEAPAPLFKKVVAGKIEFLGAVRGKDDPIYLRYRNLLWVLAPEYAKTVEISTVETSSVASVRVITEGQTDWKHLKVALRKLQEMGDFRQLEIAFDEYDDRTKMGDSELKEMCIQLSKAPQPKVTIAIFDSDDQKMLKDVTTEGQPYKSWRNNVFSLALPVPEHRRGLSGVCTELYYQDSEITRMAANDRRLYLSNEFSAKSMLHKSGSGISTSDKRVFDITKLTVIDDRVFQGSDENIALTKNSFADHVLNQDENFNDFDVSAFKSVFDAIDFIENRVNLLHAHL